MAHITSVNGGHRVQIKKKGVRASATFDSPREAKEWAIKREAEILAGARGAIPDKTLGDLLTRYSKDVSAHKRGKKWEQARIEKLKRDPVAQTKLEDLKTTHLAAWRDRRLQEISPGSVRREMTLLSHALNIATDEWHWLPASPMRRMRRPQPPEPRYRRVSVDELDRICHAAGWKRSEAPDSATARAAAALEFAIETAMRAGEIIRMKWSEVHLADGYVSVGNGQPIGGRKTRAARRDVPLTARAKEIIGLLSGQGHETVFGLTDQQRDALFRKLTARAAIDDLHFHDSRHEGITRLARKLDVLDLARVVGIADLRILRSVYYNPTAQELAARLNTDPVRLAA